MGRVCMARRINLCILAPGTCVVASSPQHRILLPFPTGLSSHVLVGRCPAAHSLLRSAAEYTLLGKESGMVLMYRGCTGFVHHGPPARGRHSCCTARYIHTFHGRFAAGVVLLVAVERNLSIHRSPALPAHSLSPGLNIANKAIPSFSSTDLSKSGVSGPRSGERSNNKPGRQVLISSDFRSLE
jgi:hypothetical protein